MEHPQSTPSRLIPLYGGGFAIVDAADYEWLSQWNWRLHQYGYAVRPRLASERPGSNRIRMHRLILNAPDGVQVDHINHNRLDNRRSNIRLVTAGQNCQNLDEYSVRSRTGVRNVWYRPKYGTYQVRLSLHNQRIHCGIYQTLEEAQAAAREARRRYYTHSPECEATDG